MYKIRERDGAHNIISRSITGFNLNFEGNRRANSLYTNTHVHTLIRGKIRIYGADVDRRGDIPRRGRRFCSAHAYTRTQTKNETRAYRALYVCVCLCVHARALCTFARILCKWHFFPADFLHLFFPYVVGVIYRYYRYYYYFSRKHSRTQHASRCMSVYVCMSTHLVRLFPDTFIFSTFFRYFALFCKISMQNPLPNSSDTWFFLHNIHTHTLFVFLYTYLHFASINCNNITAKKETAR